MATIFGTAGNDNWDNALEGSEEADIFYGGDGNDWFWPVGGADMIYGGDDSDTVFFEGGSSVIINNTSDFRVGLDPYTVFRDYEVTTLDSIESLHGSHYDDVIYSDLRGYAFLRAGDDFYWTDQYNLVYGGSGDDTVMFDAAVGGIVSYFDDGYDMGGTENAQTSGINAVFEATPSGNFVTVSDGWGDTDSLYNVSRIIGSAQSDRIDATFSDRGVSIDGLDGGGTILGSAFDDDLSGGNGNEWIAGRAGHDLIYGGGGSDYLNGGAGMDELYGGSGQDVFIGWHTDMDGDIIYDFEVGEGILFRYNATTTQELSITVTEAAPGTYTLSGDFGSMTVLVQDDAGLSFEARNYAVSDSETDAFYELNLRYTNTQEIVFDGNRYVLVVDSFGFSWDEAAAGAEALGGQLASINTAEENQALYDLSRLADYAWNGVRGPWLGGYQDENAAEPAGGWMWLDGTPITLDGWEPGEPNDAGGYEDHLHFDYFYGQEAQWNDLNQSSAQSQNIRITSYIVEIADQPPVVEDVTISGTAALNSVLTASATISDPDGVDGTTTYQWLRDGTPITGATSATYTVTGADQGTVLSVTVTHTDATDLTADATGGDLPIPAGTFRVTALADDTTTDEAGGTATVRYWLDTAPIDPVVLTLSLSDTTEGNLSTTTLTFTAENWDQPQTVTITGVDDYLNDGDQAYMLLATVSTEDLDYRRATVSTVTLLNGDDGLDVPKTLYGDNGTDILTGGNGDDRLYGGGNLDRLLGGYGNDRLYGGYEDDDLRGEDGNDWLYGEYDDDRLEGGAGHDELYGGAGIDTLYGGSGNDVLDGGEQADVMYGGEGDDTYYVDSLNDVIVDTGVGDSDTVILRALIDYVLADGIENASLDNASGSASLGGNDAANELTGNNSGNTLSGGGGSDTLYSAAGNDLVLGGSGDDLIIGGSGLGRDKYNGGAGIDTVKYTSAEAGIIVSLAGGTAQSAKNDLAKIGKDTLISVENVIAGDFGDVIEGSKAGNEIFGQAGADKISGLGGNDVLHGGAHRDVVKGGTGRDIIYGDGGNDVLFGNGGNDTFVFAAGDGADRIRDFNIGQDLIQIDGAQFDDLILAKSGTAVTITWQDISIQVDNVKLAALNDIDNFLLL